MQDVPLSVARILEHGTGVHGDAVVVTATGDGSREATYAEIGQRAARLANALQSLGVGRDDRVATFMWNNQEHLEAYLAVPAMGAILHTLNIRLFPEQLTYIANHAEDKVVIVDASLVPALAALIASFETVEHVLVAGPEAEGADLEPLRVTGKLVSSYEEVLAAAEPTFDWVVQDERNAAAMCYTSGTTGNPKGVVYSHRSICLHSMGLAMGDGLGMHTGDRVLPVVPMFHANAWGLVYSALMTGASLTMPDRWLQAEPLVRFIEQARPTVAGGVPTVWNDVISHVAEHGKDLSSLRLVACGGSAVPVSLQQRWEEQGVLLLQAWGMTETSPVAAMAWPPVGVEGDDAWTYRGSAGRPMLLVEARIVGEDDGIQPADGTCVGELEVRGPWVTGAYYREDDPGKFHDGWLRTGDVGTLDELGYIRLTDRSKDVIKSGGEWISSVELENAIMSHPDVVEAAVVGIPDERWQERPLATVVVREGATVTPGQLRAHLAESVARWQLPDAWAFIAAVPRTSVGKFDKKVLRRQYSDGELDVAAADGE